MEKVKIKILISFMIISIVSILMLNIKTTTLNKSASIIQVNSSVSIQNQRRVYVADNLVQGVTDKKTIKKNTENLQALIDKASNEGGIVYIPAGTYYFAPAATNGSGMGEHVIYCKSNVTIEGAGIDETSKEYTTLKPYGDLRFEGTKSGGIDMFYFNIYSDEKKATYLENADFRNLIIDGGDAGYRGNYDSSGKGILTVLSINCHIENVIVRNTMATGIGLDAPINCTIKNTKVINCGRGVTSKDSPGGSGFGIGTGFSNEESLYITNCVAEGNGKFGFFFEHQGRFKGDTKWPAKDKGAEFVVSNCKAGGNMYDFGTIRGNDVTYENCVSYTTTNKYTNYREIEIKNISAFNFENKSTRIHMVNCKSDQKFTDVNSSRYYYEPVYWALNNAITNGTTETTFSPEQACTRSQAIVMLWRMAERPGNIINVKDAEVASFFEGIYTDVASNKSYVDAVKWAKEKLILDTTSEIFRPTDGCTRAEFVTFLYKYAGEPKVSTKNNFDDVTEGSKYEDAVNWAVNKGIVKGTTKITFSPNEVCKRGEVVTFLYRYAHTKNKFSITYNLNGGTMTVTEEEKSYEDGKDSFTISNPTRTGYTFLGWTGSNNSKTPEKTVKITTSDVGNKTYTANWAPNNYKVSFKANGGKGSMADEYFTYDMRQVLSENKFTRSNYKFKGWNTKANGTGKSYKNNEEVMNLLENSNETITLYAQWQKVTKNSSKIIKLKPLPFLPIYKNFR